MSPLWRENRGRDFASAVLFLQRQQILSKKSGRKILSFYGTASSVIHGQAVNLTTAKELIEVAVESAALCAQATRRLLDVPPHPPLELPTDGVMLPALA